MADDRTYIRVHDGMDDHPKIVGLSDGAFRLLMRSWSYCSRQLTDGRLPDAAWRDRGSAKSRRELVDAGLAHLPGHTCHHPDCPPPPPRHVQMHDYLEHQRSAAEVAELKRKRAEAGSKGGKAKASATANAKQVLQQTASKTVPSTETETYKKNSSLGGSHVSSATDEPPRCSQHKGMRREDVPACWACGHKREQWEMSRSTDAVFDRAPWCGADGCNPMTRLLETPVGVIRCPECHPLADEVAS